MAGRMVGMRLRVDEKRTGIGVTFLTASMTARESVGSCPLSISTTPSCVRMMPVLDLKFFPT
jgi:hypothetical protein